MKTYFLIIFLTACFFSCTESKDEAVQSTFPAEVFKQTWYAGKAEISSFTLQQARYGEIRDGEAVLIFVTEDFSANKKVKLDDPENSNDKIRVMKMNMSKKFNTGIYPYSMMLSVFTPVVNSNSEKTIKVNSSSQEWCGHTFSQLLLNGTNYDWQLHSYFEKEAEQQRSLEAVDLEDELWNRIRLDPSRLPTGKKELIPGLFWQRLSHRDLEKETAVLILTDSLHTDSSRIKIYTIDYRSSGRILKIYFKEAAPYAILGWEESYPDGFGNNKKRLTTKAVLKKTSWLSYWKLNASSDSIYRDSLQLNHE